MARPPSYRSPSGRARRHRRSRLRPVIVFVVVVFGLAWFLEQRATTTVIFVRNADIDRPVIEGSDPPLNARGRRRAQALADFLGKVDVVGGVNVIYADKTRRTQQTAAPLAKRLGLKVKIENPYHVEKFMNQVLRKHKGQIILVVTQGDALAPLVEQLHGSKHLPKFGPHDYDEVYILSIPWFGKVKTLRLHYGFVPQPGETLNEAEPDTAPANRESAALTQFE